MSQMGIQASFKEILEILKEQSDKSVASFMSQDEALDAAIRRLFSYDEPLALLTSLIVRIVMKFGDFQKVPDALTDDMTHLASELDETRKDYLKAQLKKKHLEARENTVHSSSPTQSFSYDAVNTEIEVSFRIFSKLKTLWDRMLMKVIKFSNLKVEIQTSLWTAAAGMKEDDYYTPIGGKGA